jgi:hypothetical protein
LVTIDFSSPATVEPSPDFEIVSRSPRRVVIRTFQPKPVVVHGSAGDVTVAVRSVLKPNEPMQPAPLEPPRADPYPPLPFYAIAAAALFALAMWLLTWMLARRRQAKPEVLLPPADAFRARVLSLRNHPKRWAALADALRAYLAATDSRLGSELTTSEILARTDDPVMAAVLRQGDLEKFSPWGASPADFDALAQRALALIPEELEQAA